MGNILSHLYNLFKFFLGAVSSEIDIVCQVLEHGVKLISADRIRRRHIRSELCFLGELIEDRSEIL